MTHAIAVPCPQESISNTADSKNRPWGYKPGAYPKLDAAIDEHAAAHGTIWSPHLLGPDFISFETFLNMPELAALCPQGSDARFVLEEFRKLQCFSGSRDESRRALTAHIRTSALFQRCGSYRYIQRIFNSIWRNYDGLLDAKQANLKALVGAENRVLREDERKTKDAARKAAERSNDLITRSSTLASRSLRFQVQASKLRNLAKEKERKAKKWLGDVEALNARAADKEDKFERIERQLEKVRAKDLS